MAIIAWSLAGPVLAAMIMELAFCKLYGIGNGLRKESILLYLDDMI